MGTKEEELSRIYIKYYYDSTTDWQFCKVISELFKSFKKDGNRCIIDLSEMKNHNACNMICKALVEFVDRCDDVKLLVDFCDKDPIKQQFIVTWKNNKVDD